MSFAYWTVLLTALLPIVWVGVAKSGADGYDNHKPRIFLAGLKDWPQRANWAQANAFEAFPAFAAAVIIAHLAGANQLLIDSLAGVFLIVRIAHGIFYIRDMPTPRSWDWNVGYLCTMVLFLAAGWANF
jgi:uncharacterized MAPEG superfamily protein